MKHLNQAKLLFSRIKRSVYQSSQGKCPEDYLYIMPSGGIGELVLTCAQTHHVRQKHPVCLILRSDRQWLPLIYPNAADLVIFVEPGEVGLLSLLDNECFLHPGHLMVSYVAWLVDDRFASTLVMKEKLLGFKQSFAFMLDLPLDAPIEHPKLLPAALDVVPQEKSVLIMPSANFTRKIDARYWDIIVRQLVARGYTVYWEKFGTVEMNVDGVVNVDNAVPQFIELARRCKNVLMLRSGLSDLTSAYANVLPDLRLAILWHLDPATAGTVLEEWHTPGCSVGFPSSKTWFDCGDNVIDIELAPPTLETQPEPFIDRLCAHFTQG